MYNGGTVHHAACTAGHAAARAAPTEIALVRCEGAGCQFMWRAVHARRLSAPLRGWNSQGRWSLKPAVYSGIAAAGAAGAVLTSGSSCSPQKAPSEVEMIEALQLVILEKIEARLTVLERFGIKTPGSHRSAAATGAKATPAAQPAPGPATSNGLQGRRILVTAPSTYAARLAGQVLARGGRPICMPTIVTEPLQEQDHDKLDAALRSMASAAAAGKPPAFAYIAFTSRNGIEAFLRRAAVLGLDSDLSGLLRGCTVCALGNDAKMLEQSGIEVGLLPTVSSPTGMIEELAARGEAGRGRTILVPVPEVTGVPEPPVVPNFVAGLNKLGMSVHRCVHSVSTSVLPFTVIAMY